MTQHQDQAGSAGAGSEAPAGLGQNTRGDANFWGGPDKKRPVQGCRWEDANLALRGYEQCLELARRLTTAVVLAQTALQNGDVATAKAELAAGIAYLTEGGGA